MTFLHTSLAVAGFAAVAIPIVIHLLFRQRRRPLPWAAMRFLLEALRKQRKRLRLETLILLAVRCLLLACLAAAIARPILAGAGLFGSVSGRDVYLLMDNSVASAVRSGADGGDTALGWQVKRAKALIDSLTVNDRVGLLTLGGPAAPVVVPASSDARAVAGLLDGLASTDSACDLAGAMERLGSTLRSERGAVSSGVIRPVTVCVFSGFGSGSADLSRPLPGSLQGLEGVSIVASSPLDWESANVQIVGLEPLRSVVMAARGGSGGGEASQVRVLLRRTGAAVRTGGVSTVRVSASGNGAMTASAVAGTVRWNAGQSEGSVTVQLDAGAASGAGGGKESVLVAEIDRDALANDNIRRRPVEVRDRLQVGVVAQRAFGSGGRADQLSSAEWYRLALRPVESAPIEVVDIEPSALDAPALALLDAVVLPSPDLMRDDSWQKIRRFADAGGLVIVSPPEGVSVHLWADGFTKVMGLGWRIAREASIAGADAAARLGEQAPGIVPGAGADGGTIFALLSQELQQLARPVTVTKWLVSTAERGSATVLLSLADGTPWMLAGRVGGDGGTGDSSDGDTPPAPAGRGLVVMFASAPVLSWTDLPARPLMVPLMQELVRQGVGEAGATLTGIAGLEVRVPQGTTELRGLDGSAGGAGSAGQGRVPVDANGHVDGVLRFAGVWRALDAAGRSRGLVVSNPDANGARLEVQAPDAVRAWLAGAVGAPTSGGGGSAAFGGAGDPASVSWLEEAGSVSGGEGASGTGTNARSAWTLPLFIGALLLAVLEVFLARWFSHAKVGGTAGSGIGPRPPDLDEVLGGMKGAAA